MATKYTFTRNGSLQLTKWARALGGGRYAAIVAAALSLAGLCMAGCHRAETSEQESPAVVQAEGGATGNKAIAKGASTEKKTSDNPVPDANVPLQLGDDRPPVFVKFRVQTSQYEDGTPHMRWREKVYSDESANKNDGPSKTWWPNGKLSEEGNYVDGLKDGEWKLWHENGKEAKTENYIHGKIDGKSTLYRDDGTKDQDLSYKAGLKDGIWIQYDKKGEKMVWQREFKADKPDGTCTEWYPSGRQQSEMHFRDGQLQGIQTFWFDNEAHQKQKELTFKDDKEDGKHTEWKETGEKIKETEFSHGRLLNSASSEEK